MIPNRGGFGGLKRAIEYDGEASFRGVVHFLETGEYFRDADCALVATFADDGRGLWRAFRGQLLARWALEKPGRQPWALAELEAFRGGRDDPR